MNDIRIGKMAELSAVTATAIRYYEAEGLLPVATRRSGQRIFDLEAFQRLTIIKLAKDAGLTVAEMKSLMSGISMKRSASRRWKMVASAKIREIERQIEKANKMKRILEAVARCDCPTFEDCANRIRDQRTSPGADGRC